jgi:solute carrier family 13 (sodium-dependent dicarboxylate transporter), member 2/3/5
MDADKRRLTKRIGLTIGPVLFIIVLFAPILEDLSFEAKVVLAATFWMSVWWITEAIPIYVTAFLPLIIFPTLGATELGATSASYADRVVFLFLGGFILAKAVEKSNLHRRFALSILKTVGTNPKYIVAAFMLVTGFLSGWMSNTATAMLMLPIAAAVISQMQNKHDRDRFGLCLMLSLAYSASIGGMATLIGTPPNAIFASLSGSLAETQVSFGGWLMIGLPISAISLVVAWLYMVNVGASIRGMAPISKEKGVIADQLTRLGRITRDEKAVLAVFAATATAWITRGLLWQDVIPGIDDSTIVIIAALLLFLIPSEKSNRKDSTKNVRNNAKREESPERATGDNSDSYKRLMNWRTAVTIPWGVLLLIGGGLALANAYTTTGLDSWIAHKLEFLSGVSFLVLIFAMVAVAVLASEIMSNTASAALLIPISASLAASLNIDPILLMVPVTIATSYGFMMPVGTPPNAIVFSSGYVTIPKMVRAGLPLDIIGILLVTALTAFMVPLLWG